ncbi:MAG: flagellar motor switch protein FliM [Oscillospiraceae bacterium]|nr:flagellar motor switch protein FliM [Oscillospiraceae bacterium]
MAEALSQSQIDELLNKMRTGSVEKPQRDSAQKIKEYDFSSPKKFTKDQLKSLNNLYENYSRILSSYFTSILRSACEVTISQIEEQRYYEFTNALPDSTLIGIFTFQPEESAYGETTMMIEFSTVFGFLLIDRLMGGTAELVSLDRDYTDIELSLLDLVMNKITYYLQEAWSSFFPLQARFVTIETNGRFVQTFAPQDVVVIITFDIDDEYCKTAANICMPAENLEELISSLSVKYNHAMKKQDALKEKQKRDRVFDYLKQSEINLEAHLDDCFMSLGEIAQLQVNDVIFLNKRINEDISVSVEGIPCYKARLGEIDAKMALRIVNTENSLDDRKEG